MEALKKIFSNGWVILILVLIGIYILYYFAFIYGYRAKITDVNANSFNIKVTNGYKTVFDKKFSWGDSWSQHIGDKLYSFTSNNDSKTMIFNTKWDNGETSWFRYDYLNQKTSLGEGTL